MRGLLKHGGQTQATSILQSYSPTILSTKAPFNNGAQPSRPGVIVTFGGLGCSTRALLPILCTEVEFTPSVFSPPPSVLSKGLAITAHGLLARKPVPMLCALCVGCMWSKCCPRPWLAAKGWPDGCCCVGGGGRLLASANCAPADTISPSGLLTCSVIPLL